jgi:hypothetical protein
MEGYTIIISGKKQDPSEPDGSKNVVVGDVLHDVLHTAVQDVAESVDGVDLHIFVLAEPVELGAVDVMVGVQVILGNTALFHGFPKSIIFDHAYTSQNLLT